MSIRRLRREQGEVDDRGDAEQPDDDEDDVLHDADRPPPGSPGHLASSRRMSTRFSSTEDAMAATITMT